MFFFFRVLHIIFSHLRAHAFARSVTVARSSAVQASSSRRQESGPSYVAPCSRNPPTGRRNFFLRLFRAVPGSGRFQLVLVCWVIVKYYGLG